MAKLAPLLTLAVILAISSLCAHEAMAARGQAGNKVCTVDEDCVSGHCSPAKMCAVCGVDAHCPPTKFCTARGACEAQKPGRVTCNKNSECLSGKCIEVGKGVFECTQPHGTTMPCMEGDNDEWDTERHERELYIYTQ